MRNRVFVQVESAEFLPTVSITGRGDVNEGGVALYTISVADLTDDDGFVLPRGGPITVNINTTESVTNYISGTPANAILIPANVNQVIYAVQTARDDADGANGTITAEVLPGAGYKLGATATRTANVSVLDDTGFPVVTFTNFSTTGTEGTRLVYPFTLSAASTGNISVSYTGNTGTSAIFGEDYTFSNLSSTRIQNNVDRGNIYIDLIADNLV